MIDLDIDNFYSIGHRGMEIGAVENSKEAFENALKFNLDFIELDVQSTKDKHIVVFHDDLLDKKTEFSGKIRDYTIDKLANCEVITSQGRSKMIQLEELFKLVEKSTIKLIIELKTGENLSIINDLIYSYHLEDRVIIDSFDFNFVLQFQKISPQLSYTWLVNYFKFNPGHLNEKILLKRVLKYKLSGASFHFRNLTNYLIQEFKKHELFLFCWGVKHKQYYDALITSGINGFTAPDPQYLLQLLDKK